MINFFICVLLSVLSSFGMAIALTEKGNEFPIKKYRVILQKLIHDHIGWKWSQVLFCPTCSSFWLTLLTDFIIGIIVLVLFGMPYFFWPLSGFISVGFTWWMIEFLNATDSK